ncbi:MAG: PsbP-related protein [Candidatus Eremiobacterota bacterium]
MNKYSMTLLLCACMFLLFICQSLAAGDNPSKEYKDKGERFSLMVPAGWKAFDDRGNVYFEHDGFASFSVDGFPVEKNETLADLVSRIEPYDFKNETMEIHSNVIEKTDTTVDGVPAVRIIQRSEAKGIIAGEPYAETDIIDGYFFIKNNHVYIITLNSPEATYKNISSDFERAVKSFKAGTKPFEAKSCSPSGG